MDARRRHRPTCGLAAVALGVCLCQAGSAARSESLDGEVLDWVKRATVYVFRVESGWSSVRVSSASGFFVSPQGHLVTSAEIVTQRDSVQVVVNSGLPTQRILAAKVVKRVEDSQVAIVKTDAAPDAWLLLAAGRCPRETERVWALGFPQGSAPGSASATTRRPGAPGLSGRRAPEAMMEAGRVRPRRAFPSRRSRLPGAPPEEPGPRSTAQPVAGSQGPAIVITGGSIISLPRGADGRLGMMQTDARVCQGDSGGPFVDATGRVVGVVLGPGRGVGGFGTACAIPAEAVLKLLQGVVPLTAEAAYSAALAYRKEHPDDPKGTHARCGLVVQGWPESREAKLARTRLDAAADAWRRMAGAELGRRRQAARKMARSGDYQGAIAELRGFPDKLLNDHWSRQIAATVAPYLEAVSKFEEARRVKAEVEAPLWRVVFPHFQARSYDLALSTARDFLARERVPSAAACLADLKEIAAAAKEFWGAVLKGAPHAKSQELRLKGALWQIAGARGDHLVLRFGGAERLVKATDLSVEQAILLIEWRGPATGLDYVLACVYSFDAEWDQARRHAAQVAEGKKPALLGSIALWREQHAERLLGQARKAMTTRRHKDAAPILESLRDSYADLEAVKQDLPWIERSTSICSQRAAGTPGKPESPSRMCRRCTGTGKISVTKKRRSGMNWEIYRGYERCPRCKGSGRSTTK